MNAYKVFLTRSYVVTIKANSEDEAVFNSEFYIGGEKDLSDEAVRKIKYFEIQDIEMTVNEAIEVEQVLDIIE